MIDFDTIKKLARSMGDLDKLIVAKGFKKFPKVQLIAQSGHTDYQNSGEENGRMVGRSVCGFNESCSE